MRFGFVYFHKHKQAERERWGTERGRQTDVFGEITFKPSSGENTLIMYRSLNVSLSPTLD